ncbi:chorismate synthase [Citrifermentans bemidjiense Bem]|uniref:Chorismate synthase n=1 Tax=Citrifermentans bemidjiense (strain ATCC BAA-1014 / DSM 16622 / JCM 12645 / Bem) TaxID=404380 RepID=B5E8I7_CITBB|nr:chorismate synthase [Citrifermentans bemidjiense]ACH38572.1 chorismate synthase [Citrifermentans bemidjiense Bem]
MFRYLTAGESHGPQLTAIVEGVPSGLKISEADINVDLARRQGGYGRGGRMKIETDKVQILSGVRWGETMGSPITLVVENSDWVNWEERMSPYAEHRDDSIRVTRARPGHADLPGAMKYCQSDVRNILERSSARETAVRVAVGAVAKAYLARFGIAVTGCVLELGGVKAERPDLGVKALQEKIAASPVYTYDPKAELEMIAAIDRAKDAGDTLGGVVEVRVTGLPVGLGSHVQWDRRLDARLAAAVMSIQAFKGVEVGAGFETARLPGSQVHDEIFFDQQRVARGEKTGFYRNTNRAGGLEGGITNGEEIVICGAMKPIPTLYQPLQSVDILTKEPFEATVERSDCCAVPAASVVAEAVVAIEIASAFMDKFGGDSVAETARNYSSYIEYLREF